MQGRHSNEKVCSTSLVMAGDGASAKHKGTKGGEGGVRGSERSELKKKWRGCEYLWKKLTY